MEPTPFTNRILLHPLVGAISALVVVLLASLLLGSSPHPAITIGLMLIGTGIGLVVARFGNMGPFQGEFGSPWFEADLGETLRREVARSARFGRELSIVAVRQTAGQQIPWDQHIREADQAVACRNGWTLMILAETGKDGAQRMVERATAGISAEIQAVIMDPSVTHHDPRKLGAALLELVRNPSPLESPAPVSVRRDTDRLQWPAG